MIAMTGCRDSAWTPMGSAEVVLSEIKLGGAAAVSRRIDSEEDFASSVMSGIATGDSVWLQVADRIAPASAAAEATMSIALASALTHSPERVLALVGRKYPVEEVCGIPFLKGDSAFVTSYYADAIAALRRVRSASLSTTRDSCRAALDDARARRLERINPSYIVKNKPVAPPRRVQKRAPVKAKTVAPKDTASVAKPPQAATPTDTSSAVKPPQAVTPKDSSSSD
jgi:cell division septation protein DedD